MPPVDITFTVKASVSNGRRLMQNEDGTTFWEGDEPVPEGDKVEADVLIEPEPKPEPVEEPVKHAHKPRAKKRLLHG